MKYIVTKYGYISNIAVAIGEYIVHEYNINMINRLNQIAMRETINNKDYYDDVFEDVGNIALQTGII